VSEEDRRRPTDADEEGVSDPWEAPDYGIDRAAEDEPPAPTAAAKASEGPVDHWGRPSWGLEEHDRLRQAPAWEAATGRLSAAVARGREDWVGAVAVTLVVLACTWKILAGALLGGATLFAPPELAASWALRGHAWRGLFAAGDLPIWTGRVPFGAPLAAEWRAGLLDPVATVGAWLSHGPQTAGLVVAFYLWLGALGVYAFARALRLRPAPAALAAVVGGLLPYTLATAHDLPALATGAWMGWFAALLVRTLDDPSPLRAGGAALFAGFALLSGGTARAAATAVPLAFLVAAMMNPAFGRRPRGSGLALAGVLVFGTALAGPSMLPALDLGAYAAAPTEGPRTLSLVAHVESWRTYLLNDSFVGQPIDPRAVLDPAATLLFALVLPGAFRTRRIGAPATGGLVALAGSVGLLPGSGPAWLAGFYLAAGIVVAAELDRFAWLGESGGGYALLSRTAIAGLVVAVLLAIAWYTTARLGTFLDSVRALANPLVLAAALGLALVVPGIGASTPRKVALWLIVAIVSGLQIATYAPGALAFTPARQARAEFTRRRHAPLELPRPLAATLAWDQRFREALARRGVPLAYYDEGVARYDALALILRPENGKPPNSLQAIHARMVEGEAPEIGLVRAVREHPWRTRVRYEAPGGGYLVVGEAPYPGWRAERDGRAHTVLPAAGIFQTVRVPPGEGEIVLTYDPLTFRVGAFAAIAALGGLFSMTAGLALARRIRHAQ